MSTPTPQTKQQRREASRQAALALKQKQEAAEKRNRTIMATVLGVAILGLVGAGIFIGMRGNSSRDSVPNFDATMPVADVTNVPANATDDFGFIINADGAAVAAPDDDTLPTLAVYFDYMCPACHAFEDANLPSIRQMVADGETTLVLHPLAILDRMSQRTQFSTRSASAIAWIADRAPQNFLAFHEGIFTEQPGENTEGITNAHMAEIAVAAGVPQAVADGIADGTATETFGQWITSITQVAVTDTALQNPQTGSFGTPTILVAGDRFGGNWMDPQALVQAVATAR
jgi:protein-disulfide isomerase